MRPIVAAVFLAIALAGALAAGTVAGYKAGCMDCQRIEPQQVTADDIDHATNKLRWEVRDADSKLWNAEAAHRVRIEALEAIPNCDCAALKAEAVEYVRKVEARLNKLESENVHDQKMMDQFTSEIAVHLKHIDALEKSACKCKCR